MGGRSAQADRGLRAAALLGTGPLPTQRGQDVAISRDREARAGQAIRAGMTQPRRPDTGPRSRGDGLTVAVTGPTGDIGKPLVRALERSRSIARVIGMARRPFDPAEHGWRKTEYRQGDVLDRASVEALVAGADVVVHLAFLIFGARDETREVNLRGSRNVFEAAVDAGTRRLVYTSSVAAYGFS